MTVSELLDRTSSLELSEWRAYERDTGPIGQQRDDQLAAMVAFYTVRALTGKSGKSLKLRDVVPSWKPDEPQDWRTMRDKLKALTVAAGGEVIEAPRE